MLNFKRIIFPVLVLLSAAFLYQAYWVRSYYREQSSKLELDILSAMRSANDLLIFQKGKQVDIEELKSVDFYIYQDLLQAELMQRNLLFESILELVILKSGDVLARIPDTAINRKDSGYKEYTYTFDLNQTYAYRLEMKDTNRFLLNQMSGILWASLLVMIALILSYLYLLKIIFHQKNLDEIKSDFVNNMTHELKTPISVAYAATDALLNHGMIEEEEKRKIYLTAAQKQLEHLSGLVEQILTMSVEERKNIQLEFSPCNVQEIFGQLKQQCLLNVTKPTEIQIDVIPENITVKADKTHFKNILVNLIENAIKYSGDQVGIVLSARQKNEEVWIGIRDNGIGIPASSLPKIFYRFYRVPTGDIHNVKGYGLGLYYVKTTIEKHGWSIEVQSKERKGTEFLIRIPAR